MTGNEILSYLLAVLVAGLTIIFYFTMLKPKQNEKKESQGTGTQDIISAESDQYADIINDYPTYHRQK